MTIDAARDLAREVDARALANSAQLPATTAALYGSIRQMLMDASNERALSTSPYRVAGMLSPRSHTLPRQGFVQVNGGSDAEAFVRALDGARFTFGVTAEYPAGREPRLVSFRYQLEYQGGDASPRFLRFDLNSKSHENPVREPQCHLHPGHEEIRCPLPLIAPAGMLALLIYGCALR